MPKTPASKPSKSDKPARKLPRAGPRTKFTSTYAQARVSAGLTYRDMLKMGFSSSVINAAEHGRLPPNRHLRLAYLAAINLAP